jgi:hypothetical protein
LNTCQHGLRTKLQYSSPRLRFIPAHPVYERCNEERQ